jgi:hypothetical protein
VQDEAALGSGSEVLIKSIWRRSFGFCAYDFGEMRDLVSSSVAAVMGVGQTRIDIILLCSHFAMYGLI